MIKVGPSGNSSIVSSNNRAWDDKEKAGAGGLCRIYVSYNSNGVRSIQSAYMVGKTLVASEKNGYVGTTADHFHSINLDYPSEYITSITGYHGNNRILSITFGTNRHTYGPFGSAERGSSDRSYSMTFVCGEFLGFHGYANDSYITAIGAYLKPYVGPSTSTSTSTAGLIKSEKVGCTFYQLNSRFKLAFSYGRLVN